MPINSFTVGKDLSFVLVTPTGTLSLNGLTDYTPKPMFTDLKHKDLDGSVQHAHIPDGWEISIKVDRKDPTLDNFFAQLEASYFAGVNVQNGSITETIVEADGSVSQFRYTKVTLKFDDAGSFKGDSLISQGITASASRRIKVA